MSEEEEEDNPATTDSKDEQGAQLDVGSKTAPLNMCSVYVGNLSYDVTQESLRELFNKYGRIKEIRVPSVWEGSRYRARGFAFVEFECQEDAQSAVDALNEKVNMGRALRVNIATHQDRSMIHDGRRHGDRQKDDQRYCRPRPGAVASPTQNAWAEMAREEAEREGWGKPVTLGFGSLRSAHLVRDFSQPRRGIGTC